MQKRTSKRQFSGKVGTIFEDSPIALEKWFIAVWMISNCRNGISSYEVGRAIGVTRSRHGSCCIAFDWEQSKDGGKLGGSGNKVEIDETFIGGKARNMHKSRKNVNGFGKKYKTAKTAVSGMLERGGKSEGSGHRRATRKKKKERMREIR